MKYPTIDSLKTFIFNAENIRFAYGGVYSENFNKKYIEDWREYILNLPFPQKHKELMWEYLNYDVDIYALINELLKKRK